MQIIPRGAQRESMITLFYRENTKHKPNVEKSVVYEM